MGASLGIAKPDYAGYCAFRCSEKMLCVSCAFLEFFFSCFESRHIHAVPSFSVFIESMQCEFSVCHLQPCCVGWTHSTLKACALVHGIEAHGRLKHCIWVCGHPQAITEVCCVRRGMAKFDEGLPWEEKDAFRFIYGAQEGLVGVYPVSANEIFYFCAFPASRVRGTLYIKHVDITLLHATLLWRACD